MLHFRVFEYMLRFNVKPIVRSKIMFSSRNKFNLSNYEVVGLDFDNTLVQYNLSNLFQLHYSYLTNFLVQKKSYHGLPTEMDHEAIDFIRRGLFMDFQRGNILDISCEGVIINASHGTKKIQAQEVTEIYGEDLRWSATDLFIKDKLALWEGPASDQTRTFLDYSDTTGTLVYAKLIDLLDENGKHDYSSVWPHLLEAIIDMYRPDSDFSKELLRNVTHYIHKCELNVIDYLKKLRERHKLLLITGSQPITVKPMAEYALGTGWESLFNTIVYSAKKPSFFTGTSPFLDEYDQPITLKTSQGQHYARGSWLELYNIIEKEMGKAVKCVYLGDSTIQDIYAPFVAIKPIDSVAVMDEVLADGHFQGEHPHVSYVKSQFWGPYFGKNNITTVMGDMIMKMSKLCIPSVSCLASKPLDYEHTPFWQMTS